MKKVDFIRKIVESFALNPSDERWASTLIIFCVAFLSISFLLYAFLSYRKKDTFFRIRTLIFVSISIFGFYVLYCSPHVHHLLQVTNISDFKIISGL